MKARVPLRLVAAVAAIATAGWDTQGYYKGEFPLWTSMYEGALDDDYVELWRDGQVHPEYLVGNEHAELGHLALLQLGWRDVLYGDAMPTMIDLNASVWHTEVRDGLVGSFPDGDDPTTALTERTLPHPARWAGVADFSYTAYDWINRNVMCPAVPAAEPTSGLCHEYTEWLGAALNASHFGEQTTRMYQRLHAIALALGRNAGAMRAALDRTADADRAEVERLIREAELWALAFEGYAQHFLHDRWSSGHMWSRYGSPEYQGPGTLLNAQVVGGFSGLIHGAEAVLAPYVPGTWAPDALCSPLMIDGAISDTALPIEFVSATGASTPAIGDYRLHDAFDGAFGAEYGYDDAPLDVTTQMEGMMQCSRAGWADVARGFGANPDGTVGVLGLAIDGAATFAPGGLAAIENGDTVPCFEMWATNLAMVYAVNDPTKQSMWVALTAAAAGSMSQRSQQLGALVGLDLPDVGKTFFQIQAHGLLDPAGTDLADGRALPTLLGTASGAAHLAQAPASYIEPDGGGRDDPFGALPLHADRWDLPAVGDRPGRDRHTLHGFANRAHARSWCSALDVLPYQPALALTAPEQGLRWPVPLPSGGGNQPSADEGVELARRQDACVVLADRLFDRTTAWYRDATYFGPQRELRRAGHGDAGAAVVTSACQALEAEPDAVHGGAPGYWEDNPAELHPGYVSAAAGPYATVPFYGDRVYQSVVAWCQALPVVDVDDDDVAVDALGATIAVQPGFRDDGTLSFEPAVRAPEITLRGRNFGPVAGQVQLDSERGCVTDPPVSHFADVVTWTDTAITIRVPHTRFVPDHYAITIIRADRLPGGARVRSVGRARLDVQRAAFGDVGDSPAPLPTDVTGQLFAALYPFCAGATVTAHRIHDCTGVDETACGGDGGPGTLLWADVVPSPQMSGPFPQHQWSVQQAAVCSALPGWVTCLPQYPTSFGMVYRLERTSTGPVADLPRRWRWTLIWQRPGPF